MLGKLKSGFGFLLLGIGLAWWLVLLGPELVRTRSLPSLKGHGDKLELAPGTVLVAVGAILVGSKRSRQSAKSRK